MFHNIPGPVLEQMKALEAIDVRDRQDGTPNINRLRQIPPETGKFLALMAAAVPVYGSWLEIGTSAGYSALWITRAAQLRGTKLVTFELLHDKVSLAKQTFKKAKLEDFVELINGDARGHIAEYEEIGFCFLDSEKEMYREICDLVVPRLIPGGLFLADNVISHAEDLADWLAEIEDDPRLDSLIIPVGKGVLLCRKL